MLFLSVHVISQPRAAFLLNNEALFRQECLYESYCLVLERSVAVVLHYPTHFFNHQHARIVKTFIVKGFCRVFTT